MKKTVFTLLFASLLVCGCGLKKGGSVRQDFADFGGNLRRIVSSKGVKADKNISNRDIKSSEYGYVIGGFNGRNEWLNIRLSYEDSYPDAEVVELPYYFYYVDDDSDAVRYDYDIYKLKPGRYTLVYYTTTPRPGTSFYYRSVDPEKDENELIKKTDSVYASFDLKAGELVYIGDINIKDSSSMNIINNEKYVLEYLTDNYKNINAPKTFMKKKLAQKGKKFRQ